MCGPPISRAPPLRDMFPELFVHILVVLGLVWTAAGALLLIILLIRDYKNGKLW